jgi:hypothetical protein
VSAVTHDKFNERLTDLEHQAAELRKADVLEQQRLWMVPSDWVGDPFDIPQQHLPSFDRSKINNNYCEIHSSGSKAGTVGEAASLKIQLDYLSVMERAFRSRHASSVRGQMHSAARHAGHGHSRGVFGRVRGYAQDLLKASGS